MCVCVYTNIYKLVTSHSSNDQQWPHKGCENHYKQCLAEQEFRAYGLRGLSFVCAGIPYWFWVDLHKKAEITHHENVKTVRATAMTNSGRLTTYDIINSIGNNSKF